MASRLSRSWCVAEAERESGGENKLADCATGIGCAVAGGSGFPRSRSPIFGRSCSVSVQCCGGNGGSQYIRYKWMPAETRIPQAKHGSMMGDETTIKPISGFLWHRK